MSLKKKKRKEANFKIKKKKKNSLGNTTLVIFFLLLGLLSLNLGRTETFWYGLILCVEVLILVFYNMQINLQDVVMAD